jgi:hypothetical protein
VKNTLKNNPNHIPINTVSEKLKTAIDSDGNNYLACMFNVLNYFFSSLVDEHSYQRISKAISLNCQCFI